MKLSYSNADLSQWSPGQSMDDGFTRASSISLQDFAISDHKNKVMNRHLLLHN